MKAFIFPILLTFLIISKTHTQVDYWQEQSEKLSNQVFKQLTQTANFGLTTSNPTDQLQFLVDNLDLQGKDLYKKLSQWDQYPKPTKTGFICEYRLPLDTNYTATYYVYVPKNYNPKKPSKLMVYYKGGWNNRKELPAFYPKEIVIDNPTFQYLDDENIIQIFPVLEGKLAMYGYYGYQHLRLMVKNVKMNFNINDNEVYLAGFSDGGKSVFYAAGLVPSSFAAFYPINAPIIYNPYYPNFSARSILAHIAENDGIFDNRNVVSHAKVAKLWKPDWKNIILKGKEHFYFPYQEEVLPRIFKHISKTERNPFPRKIIYHSPGNYKEFTGLDWLQCKTKEKGLPASFHYEDSISVYNSEGNLKKRLYGQELPQIEASYKANTFKINASLIEEITIYISPQMVDLNRPIKVEVNGKELFNQTLDYDKDFIYKDFINRFDKAQLWVNSIVLRL
ncbi:MAG: hypothetical protein AAFO07_03160 [Bacteroidota bacterium]